MAKAFGKNVLLAGGSWLVPAVVAVVAIPITLRGLGDNAYGVVALVGAVTGYLTLLDLGMRNGVIRFTSMFVTGGHGRAMRELLRIVVAWFAAAGVLGAIVIWVLAPWLVGSLLKIPPALVQQSVDAFRLGGVAFGFTMLASVLALVPEAFLRYDLVSSMNAAFGSGILAGPAILVLLGLGLVPVMWFSVAISAAACVAWGAAVWRLVTRVPNEGPSFGEYRREFVGFTVNTGVNRIWTVIQLQTNGLVVGIAGGTAQAAYFKVPNVISEKVNDLLSRMSTVLLPTGSQLAAEGDHDQVVVLYVRASRLFYLLNASVTGAVVVLAAPLLGFWVGPQYAVQGAWALALLTLAQAVNATSMAATHLNLALGRPRVNLVASVTNSILNLGTVYFLTVAYGITGTAASGLFAAGVVPFFLHYSHRKVLRVASWRVLRDCYLRTTAAVVAVGVVSWFAIRPLANGLIVTIALVGVVAAAGFFASAAIGAVTAEDSAALLGVVRSVLRLGPLEKPVDVDVDVTDGDGEDRD